jgi:hypothetical protein
LVFIDRLIIHFAYPAKHASAYSAFLSACSVVSQILILILNGLSCCFKKDEIESYFIFNKIKDVWYLHEFYYNDFEIVKKLL